MSEKEERQEERMGARIKGQNKRAPEARNAANKWKGDEESGEVTEEKRRATMIKQKRQQVPTTNVP